ncbi:hypothetical protein BN1723_009572 [Verticillium longisporum]|uniref:Major facilitator superfamily (MFS) profile domain-containing protein n=1 Tax=Verticillium longisporum TaxID=100787 RepID=A0A0G4KQE0_VERLO|nr:hypothetical protein BN1723_009572 [Verticillium longisporum]
MSATQLQTLTSVNELRDGSETQSIAENAQSSESHDRPGASRWAVLSAAFGITFIAVGMPNSFGVFQEYYESRWRLADVVGYQVVLISGSVLIVGGLFAASFSTQFYQLVLSQGLAFGLTRTCPQLHMSGVARARPFGSMTVHFPPSALAARASGTSMGQALTTNHYLLTLMSL